MNANQAPTYTELNALLDRARRLSGSSLAVTDAQLLGLQRRWTTTLAARLDQAIEDAGYGPSADAVTEAWHRLAADQPVLRAVLDGGLGRSGALAEALSGEYRMLALAAGLAQVDEPEHRAVELGRRFRDLITGAPARMHQVA